MLQRIRNYFLIAVVIGIFYFLLSSHLLFSSPTSIHILKKSKLSLKYTFVSLMSNDPESLLRIDDLRASGVEELMVEMGLLTQEKADSILRQIDRE